MGPLAAAAGRAAPQIGAGAPLRLKIDLLAWANNLMDGQVTYAELRWTSG